MNLSHKIFLSAALICASIFSLYSTASAEWKKFARLDEDIPTLETSCNYRLKIENSSQFFYVNSTLHYEMKDPNVSDTKVLTFNANFFVFQVILGNYEFGKFAQAYQNAPEPKYASIFIRSLSNNDAAEAVIHRYDPTYKYVTPTAYRKDLLGDSRITIEADCPPATPPQVVGALASSTYSPYYGIEKTYDGDTNNYWIGAQGGSPYTLEYELDKVHTLSKLDINWYSDYYGSSDFDVQVSVDGNTFTTVADGLDGATSVDLAGAKAQWVRIVINSINNSYYPVIREVKFSAK